MTVKSGANDMGKCLLYITFADAHKVLLFTATATFSKELEVPTMQKKVKNNFVRGKLE